MSRTDVALFETPMFLQSAIEALGFNYFVTGGEPWPVASKASL
jgi:hypothetical protein